VGHISQNVRFLRSCHTINSITGVVFFFTETILYRTHPLPKDHGIFHRDKILPTCASYSACLYTRTASRSSVSRGTESRKRDQKVRRVPTARRSRRHVCRFPAARSHARVIRKSTASFRALAYSTCRERVSSSSFICESPAVGTAFMSVAADQPSWTPTALCLTHQKPEVWLMQVYNFLFLCWYDLIKIDYVLLKID